MKMKKTDKILNWLILVALLAVITVSVSRTEKEKSDENLPSVGLSEVQGLFPEARQVLLLDTSYFAVKNGANETIGSVLLSSPYSDDVKGYAGKIPLLIALDRNGKIMQVKLLDNQETPGFLKRVTDAGYLESWNGLSVDEALQKDVDAISGATYSSMGIQNSLKARLAVLSRRSVTETTDNRTLWPNVCILVVVALALICFFNPTKTKILRFATLLLSIGILGFWRNASMSLLKFYSWISTGISWPGSAIPAFWKCFSWLFPSTFGINGFVRISNMGCLLKDVWPEFVALWIQVGFYFLTALLGYVRSYGKHLKDSFNIDIKRN